MECETCGGKPSDGKDVDSPDDFLEAVARALAGDDGCCRLTDIDGRCC